MRVQMIYPWHLAFLFGDFVGRGLATSEGDSISQARPATVAISLDNFTLLHVPNGEALEGKATEFE